MRGKYASWPHFFAAWLYRQKTRWQVKNLVKWDRSKPLTDGCTVILGMCSRLPSILSANLKCLEASRWPELKETLIVVDAPRRRLPARFEREILSRHPSLNIRFFYYDERQYAVTEKIRLPYLYAWLSWCIGLAECRTRRALIHDYDALVLGGVMGRRYRDFIESKALIQGIGWYFVNGLSADDRLACTFEAFIDVDWFKRFKPVRLLNQVGFLDGRTVDYDILLELQARRMAKNQRALWSMSEDDLVHPAQMIHQHTMFRKFPGKLLPCWSLPMIPFFNYLSGSRQALRQAGLKFETSPPWKIDLLGDGCIMNFTLLERKQVDWLLKQMVQVCVRLKISPFADLIGYGNALYAVANTKADDWWIGEFTDAQLEWIRAANMEARMPLLKAQKPA